MPAAPHAPHGRPLPPSPPLWHSRGPAVPGLTLSTISTPLPIEPKCSLFCAPCAPLQARRAKEDFLHMLKHMRGIGADTTWEAAGARPAVPRAPPAPARAGCLQRGSRRPRGSARGARRARVPTCALVPSPTPPRPRCQSCRQSTLAAAHPAPASPPLAAELCKEEPEWRELGSDEERRALLEEHLQKLKVGTSDWLTCAWGVWLSFGRRAVAAPPLHLTCTPTLRSPPPPPTPPNPARRQAKEAERAERKRSRSEGGADDGGASSDEERREKKKKHKKEKKRWVAGGLCCAS